MYATHWNFNEKPFENTPDPRFMYYSKQHLEAVTRLLYAVSEKKSAAILTGEYGSGKTVISRIVANRLIREEKHYNVALIVNPAITSLEILKEVLYQLGGEATREDQKIDVLHRLNDRLYRNMSEGRHTVIIIDEAQTIKERQVFEEIRLLLNFQSDDRFLLTLLLLGQPELKEKVAVIPQLEQRFAVKYHLTNLNLEETINYIEHRLKTAKKVDRIFTDSAYEIIYEASEGIPRKINNICDISLMSGFTKKLDKIDANIIRAVAEDLKAYARTGPVIPQVHAEKDGVLKQLEDYKIKRNLTWQKIARQLNIPENYIYRWRKKGKVTGAYKKIVEEYSH